MTPEQRVQRMYPEGTIEHSICRHLVAIQIRKAENEALERAAQAVENGAKGGLHSVRRVADAQAIRALKTRAPRKTKRGGAA